MTTLINPQSVVIAKEPYAQYGNRLNGIFLSEMMSDKESVRKLIHNRQPGYKQVLRALYTYYQNHDKNMLLDTIDALNKEFPYLCGFKTITRFNRRILVDWTSSQSSGESFWTDLSAYDVPVTAMICDNMSKPPHSKLFKNATVAGVLHDAIQNCNYCHDICPVTHNPELDILLRKLYADRNDKLHIPTYHKALQYINADLINAFSAQKALPAEDYIPAVVLLDDISGGLFNQMDYKRQYCFHQSQIGEEVLKFSYLTASRNIDKFNAAELDKYIEDVKSSSFWQESQYKITRQITQSDATESIISRHLLELNMIRPRPQNKNEQHYYDNDVARMQYMHLYLGK